MINFLTKPISKGPTHVMDDLISKVCALIIYVGFDF